MSIQEQKELQFASHHLHYDFETSPMDSILLYFTSLNDESLYAHWKTLLFTVKRYWRYKDTTFQSKFHSCLKNIEQTLLHISTQDKWLKETLYIDFIQLMAHCRVVLLEYIPFVPLLQDFLAL